MAPTGLDQSWGVADPAAAARAGVIAISMYLSWDTSKNLTPTKIKRYHVVGIGCGFNWESQAGAPLNGAAQGRTDATEAVRQAKAIIAAVGYAPKNRIVIYFSCDRDVTAAQISGPVAAYYRAARDICHAAGFGVGAYGEAALIHYLAANRITDAEWQTYAWSGGVLDPATDFYQYLNGQTLGGASVDFDKVIHPHEMGFWWPPDSPYNTGDDDVPLTDAEIDRIASKVWGHRILDSGANWTAATWLVNTRKHAYNADVKATQIIKAVAEADGLVGKLSAVVTTLDPVGLATSVRDRFVALIGGSQ